MKHSLYAEGYCFRLRPVTLSDAEFIIHIRLSDKSHTKYVHEIPNDIKAEQTWIETYFEREGDYLWIVEDKFLHSKVGLIAVYDVQDGKAEWGRWVIQKGSLAAPESVYLLYKIAFERLNLNELYCRTVEENQSVVSFHTSSGLKTRTILHQFFQLNGVVYNAVEQYITREMFYSTVCKRLEQHAYMIFQRMLRIHVGKFEFHHIGIACKNIEREEFAYNLLGYQFELQKFADEEQGIIGKFGEAPGQPRIELLENQAGRTTLTPYLDKGIKMYHYAYYVSDIEKACRYLESGRAKQVSPLKKSVYFGKRICFYMLPNMMLIELLEE